MTERRTIRPWIWLGALLLAMAAMQVGLAVRHSLWSDELFSLAMATGHSLEHPAAGARPELGDYVESPTPVSGAQLRRYAEFGAHPAGLRQVIRAVYLSDTSPPLYYVLLHGWCRLFGTSDLALRSLSILFALGCVPIVFAIGREMAGLNVGTMAALLFAMSPLTVYYAAEGRMYSLLWFCATLLGWATLRLQSGARGWAMHGLWIAAAAAGLLVHYYFVFVWGASALFLAARRGGDTWGRLSLRVVVVCLLILPWYLHVPASFAEWRVTHDWVNWRPEGYHRWVAMREILTRYFSGNGQYLWVRHRGAEAGALFIFGVTALVALWQSWRRFWSGAPLLAGLWFLLASLGPLAADVARGSYVAEYPRYGSAAIAAACLLGAWALGSWRPRFAFAALAGIALCWAPDIMGIARNRSRAGQPMRDVARQIGALGPEDLVLVHSIPSGAILTARYLEHCPAAFAVWTGQLRQRTVPASIEALVADRRRVVFVKVHTVLEPAPEEDWLEEHARKLQIKRLGDTFTSVYAPAGRERF